MRKNLILLSLIPLLFSGCQFYKPGQISQKVFGGIADNKSTLVIPTPYGPAFRVGDSTNRMEIRHPNGTVIILNECKSCEAKQAAPSNPPRLPQGFVVDNFGNATPIN